MLYEITEYLIKPHTMLQSTMSDFTTFQKNNLELNYFTEAPQFITVDGNSKNGSRYRDEQDQFKAKYSGSNLMSRTKYQSIDTPPYNIQINNTCWKRVACFFASNHSVPTNSPISSRLFKIDSYEDTEGNVPKLSLTSDIHKEFNEDHGLVKKEYEAAINLNLNIIDLYCIYANCVKRYKNYVTHGFTSIMIKKFIDLYTEKSSNTSSTNDSRQLNIIVSLARAKMFRRIMRELTGHENSKYRYSKEHGKIVMHKSEFVADDNTNDTTKKLSVYRTVKKVLDHDDLISAIFKDIYLRSWVTIKDVKDVIYQTYAEKSNVVFQGICKWRTSFKRRFSSWVGNT